MEEWVVQDGQGLTGRDDRLTACGELIEEAGLHRKEEPLAATLITRAVALTAALAGGTCDSVLALNSSARAPTAQHCRPTSL